MLTVCAACLFVATTFITVGLRTGEIAVVAPFRYASVPLSLLLGWWLWGDVPDAHRLARHRAGAGRRALYAAPGARDACAWCLPAPVVQRSPAE